MNRGNYPPVDEDRYSELLGYLSDLDSDRDREIDYQTSVRFAAERGRTPRLTYVG